MKRQDILVALIAALLASAVTLTLMQWGPRSSAPSDKSASAPIGIAAADAGADDTEIPIGPDEEINIRVYNRVSPGVVNITSTVVEFDFFFSPYASEGTGSGCVLDKKGHVLTNYHVIADARNLEVALPDNTKYRATVVGTDPQNDLAVIRMIGAPAARLHPIALGDSSKLKIGQKVLAIGNPFRLQNTLTVGIVSSLGRTIQINDRGGLVENVIQTDAAINPGNSGGPLLNALGEMVGINTLIVSPGGGNVGIGFAVPVNTVERVVGDLIKEGRVLRPWLGVDGYSINEDLASALDLPVSRGILMARVYRGSPADKAGIRGASQIAVFYNERILAGGDILTEIDGRPVSTMEEVRLALEDRRPGETVRITIYRGGSKDQKQVTLFERPRSLRF